MTDEFLPMMTSRRKRGILIFFLVSLLFAGAGYWFYRAETGAIREEKRQALEAIAGLKAGQIQNWREERLADVGRTARSRWVIETTARIVADPQAIEPRAELWEVLQLCQEVYHYSDALLISPEGDILLSGKDHPDPVGAQTQKAMSAAIETRRATLSDLYRCPHGIIHIDSMAPVRDAAGRTLALVVFRSDAEKFLYPLIQSWPTPSPSAETLLVQREGEELVFLNELRHRSNTALSLRLPMTNTTLPAVQAVEGKTGEFEGLDYRGVQVLADLRPIPGSPWFMVAKVDQHEILAEARYQSWVVAGCTLLFILLAGAVAAIADRQRRAGLYHDLYQAEREKREAEESFRATLYSIGDGVLVADREGRVRQMNPVAEALTGWTEAEARGKPLEEVFVIFNEKTRDRTVNPVERVFREGKIVGLANHTLLISREGAERPIADSGAPIRGKDGEIAGAVLVFRDQSEERAAQRALRESEERFKAAFETANVGKSITLPGGEIDVNQAFADMLGFTRDELKNKKWQDLTPPEDVGDTQKVLDPLLKGEKDSVRFEKRYLHKSGNIVYADVSKVLRRDAEGRPLHFITTVVDVTDRKRAQAALADSEVRYRRLFEAAKDGILILDAGTGEIVDVNPFLTALLGYSHEQMSGKKLWEVGSFKDIAANRENFAELQKQQYVRYEDLPLETAGGRRIEVEFVSNIYLVDHAKVIQCNIRDITDRKRAERELQESKQLLESIVENVPLMVFLKEAEDLRFVIFNRAGEDLLGYDRESLLGKNDLDLFPPEQAAFFMAKDREVLAGGSLVDIPEEPILTAKQGTRLLHTRKVCIKGADGVTKYLLGISEDISERKRAEAERDKLEEQFNQAQKMESVGRLAGGVAHDFNNQLSVIMTYADMSKRAAVPGSQLFEDLDEILKAAHRSAELTRQLLAFARKQTAEPKALDLNDTVGGMLKMLRRLIGEDINLSWMPGADLHLVMMDPTQVDQVLANLCINARDAIAGTGKITIGTENAAIDQAYCEERPGFIPGDYVMLAVSDDGAGMDQETIANIFEPFYTTKELGKGTGLGLATVYGIVKQNHGFINVYSEPGKGTTFKVYLPRLAGDGAVALKDRVVPATPGGTETVLLCEDEPEILKAAQRLLEKLGYKALPANSPQRAIQLAAEFEGEIHLLLTDVIMPKMNGSELATEILARRPGMKCLYMSGYTADVIAHHGVLEPGIRFIQKPFTLELLAAKVRETLAG